MIQTYMKANQKRSQSHRAIAKDQRKWDLEWVKEGAKIFEWKSIEEGEGQEGQEGLSYEGGQLGKGTAV